MPDDDKRSANAAHDLTELMWSLRRLEQRPLIRKPVSTIALGIVVGALALLFIYACVMVVYMMFGPPDALRPR